MLNFTAPIPLSLYIHFPWCVQKCPYCDFNSHTLKDTLPEDHYINTLIKDLEYDLDKTQGRSLSSIFLGGGTPSLFSPSAIKRLLTTIRAQIPCPPDIEITLEANPGTVEQQHFVGFHQAGTNRLSVGCQSFNDAHLKKLGRIHGGDEAQIAIKAAKKAGFSNINIDLMFGLSEQSISQALTDLEIAIALEPRAFSWYQLTLEPNTLFYQKPPPLPDDEILWEMYQQGQALLKSHGYLPYEVSAYSREGLQCQHNRNYWQYGDYLGIGAGAHAKITDTTTSEILRLQKKKHPKEYLAASDNFVSESTVISPSEWPFEFMLNALRLYEPIPYALFCERTGLPLNTIALPLQKGIELALLENHATCLITTQNGRRFLNDLVALFI